jgi:Na+/H+-dicarboxylate symporter
LSEAAGKPARPSAGPKFRAYYALAALVAGLIAGMLSGRLGEPVHGDALGVASFVGTLWLNALKMTVIPLVVAVLIVGIAKSA